MGLRVGCANTVAAEGCKQSDDRARVSDSCEAPSGASGGCRAEMKVSAGFMACRGHSAVVTAATDAVDGRPCRGPPSPMPRSPATGTFGTGVLIFVRASARQKRQQIRNRNYVRFCGQGIDEYRCIGWIAADDASIACHNT